MRGETSGSGGGEAGPSSRSAAAAGERRFTSAAQPEIMRAAEKDDHYAAYVHDACRDAFRHLFGQLDLPSFPQSPAFPHSFKSVVAHLCGCSLV